MPPMSGAAENGPVWRGPPCVRLAPSCARGSALRINCCAVNRYSTVALSRAPTAVMSEILGLRAVTRLANSRSSTPSIARLRSSTSSGLRRGTERTAAAGKVDGSPASFGPCAGSVQQIVNAPPPLGYTIRTLFDAQLAKLGVPFVVQILDVNGV